MALWMGCVFVVVVSAGIRNVFYRILRMINRCGLFGML